MEILHTFGIDPVLLIAQIINFGIILFVLRKFLYKPVMTMLQERRDEIKKSAEDAQTASKLLEEAHEKERKVLQTAQSEAKKMLEDARKQADGMINDAKEEARKETQKMINDAKEQLTSETKQAEKRLSIHISQLAIAMLAKSLPDLVTDDEKTVLIKEASKKLKGRLN
ncbi:MAG: F0F1 ATP synthase subunit B [Candidatus Levybacteria bacterium]|nr:F0F1 ATP synthase subunit B [Candidatus Levybacteria bacterium]